MSESKIEGLFTEAMKTMDGGMQCLHEAIEAAAHSEGEAVALLAQTGREQLATALELLAEIGLDGAALDAVCTALEPLCTTLEHPEDAVTAARAAKE
jgi:hypothetical protein